MRMFRTFFCATRYLSLTKLPGINILVYSDVHIRLSAHRTRRCLHHVKCQTPLHGHRLRDMLYNTNGRAHNNSTTCCTTNSDHQRTKICHIPTSWHVEMLGSGIAMWWVCCTTSCRIVVSLSVGGVVHIGSRCPCSGVWHIHEQNGFRSAAAWRYSDISNELGELSQ